MVVVVVVWYLEPWQGNKSNSKSISARSLTSHGQLANLTSPHIAATRVHSYHLYLRPTALPILPLSNINIASTSRNHGQGTQGTSWLHPNLGANAAPGKRTGISEGRCLLLSRCLGLRCLEEKRFRKGNILRDREERRRRERRERRELKFYSTKILGIYISSLYSLPTCISRLRSNLGSNAAPRHAGKRIGTSESQRLLLAAV